MRGFKVKRGYGYRGYTQLRQRNIINQRNWKGALYRYVSRKSFHKKWKDPKGGLRRKRYYINRQ